MGFSLNDFFFCVLINNDTKKNTENCKDGIKKSVNTNICCVCVENIFCNNRSKEINNCGSKGVNNAFYRLNIGSLLRIGRKNVNEVFIAVIEEIIEEMKKQEDTDTSEKSYFERMVDEQQKDNAKRAEQKKEILERMA